MLRFRVGVAGDLLHWNSTPPTFWMNLTQTGALPYAVLMRDCDTCIISGKELTVFSTPLDVCFGSFELVPEVAQFRHTACSTIPPRSLTYLLFSTC